MHPEFLRLAEGHPKTLEIVPWRGGEWDLSDDVLYGQAESLQLGFDTIEKLKLRPEFVLYPDHDELLPDRLEEAMDAVDWSSVSAMDFHFVMSYEDVDHVVLPSWPQFPHTKILRWEHGIDFISFCRFCRPSNFDRRRCMSMYPLRHLFYVTEEVRKHTRMRAGFGIWKAIQNKEVIRLLPDMTCKDFFRAEMLWYLRNCNE